MTTEPPAGDTPAAGSVGARGGDGRDHDQLPFVQRLRKSCDTLRAAHDQGVTLALKSVSRMGDDDGDVQPLVITPSACPTGPL
jgi:hypothetical protein